MLIPFSKSIYFSILKRDSKIFLDHKVISFSKQSQNEPYNSLLYHVKDISKSEITLIPVTYAHYLYSLSNKALSIYPLAVSAICTYKNKVLIGKRSSSVSSYAHHFECVPSGSYQYPNISYSQIEKSIVNELFEESSIISNSISKIQPWFIYSDQTSEVYDCVFHIQINELIQPIANKAEYTSLKWMSTKEISSLTTSNWVPLSRLLINQIKNKIT